MRFLFLVLFTLSFSGSASEEATPGLRLEELGDERKLDFVDRPIHHGIFASRDHGGTKVEGTKAPSASLKSSDKRDSKKSVGTKAPRESMKEGSPKGPSKSKSKESQVPSTSQKSKKSEKKKDKSNKDEDGKGKGRSKTSKNSSKVKSKGEGKSKGKGKGGEAPTPPPPGSCYSPLASAILAAIPEAIAQNPQRCCDFEGPSAVYITHAQANDETPSGFEIFWDSIYDAISATSEMAHVCFVMTGYDESLTTTKTLSEILIEVNTFVSDQENVAGMMSTDPTESVELIQTIRTISQSHTDPSIGVFNAGYSNIITESLVTGLDRLPFVGYEDDSAYGLEAARVSIELLGNQTAVPLCLNARPDLDFVGRRCATYYSAITDEQVEPSTGIPCSANSTVEEIYNLIVDGSVTAVLAHEDCCTVAADARERAEEATGRSVIVGCTDKDTTGNRIDFVTLQPIELQGYEVSIWANFPVQHSMEGRDGRAEQFFPRLQSWVNTAIFNVVIF